MFARAIAVVLIVLGLLPFTAPFSTCEIDHTPASRSSVVADPSAVRIATSTAASRLRLTALFDTRQPHLPERPPAGSVVAARGLPPSLARPESVSVLRI